MERAIDWIRLWRELVEIQAWSWAARNREQGRNDAWKARARTFDAQVRERWARSDSSRRTVLAALQAHPDLASRPGGAVELLDRRRVQEDSPSRQQPLHPGKDGGGIRIVLGEDDFRQEFAYLSGRDQWLARDAIGAAPGSSTQQRDRCQAVRSTTTSGR